MHQLPIEMIWNILDIADMSEVQRLLNDCIERNDPMEELVSKSLYNRKRIEIDGTWKVPQIEEYFQKCNDHLVKSITIATEEDWDHDCWTRQTYVFPNLQTFTASGCAWLEHKLEMPNIVELNLSHMSAYIANGLINRSQLLRTVRLCGFSDINNLNIQNFNIKHLFISNVYEHDECDGLIDYLRENQLQLHTLELTFRDRIGVNLLKKVKNLRIKSIRHLKLTVLNRFKVLANVSFPNLRTIELCCVHGQKSLRKYIVALKYYPILNTIKILQPNVTERQRKRLKSLKEFHQMHAVMIFEEN